MVRKGCLIGTLAIFALGILFIAGVLALIATITAPLHTPQWVQPLLCPAGNTLEVTWVQETYNSPGERTAHIECVDAAGRRTTAPALDGSNFLQAFLIYFPICLLPLLVVGGVAGLGIFLLIRRLRQQDNGVLQYPGSFQQEK